LLPSDLIGTMVYNQAKETFSTKFGPIFTQIVLADEINRSPAKVQSALLEAMAEKQVTIGDTSHKLSNPFVVLATQNPIEQEGTYNLPEAQLDRFMMKISVNYPDFNAEKSILDLKKSPLDGIKSVLEVEDLLSLQKAVDNVYVDEKAKDYIVRLVHATRPGSEFFRKEYEGAIIAGASPRASIWLYRIAKFKAFMENKEFVTPDHVLSIVENVLGHRILLSYEAIIDKMSSREIAKSIAQSVI
ncbi:MAG: MoxR-like ATPase, partial [Thermoproteota archaeon]